MLDGLNALITAAGLIFTSMFNAPFYGEMTWGYFIIGTLVISIMLTFFIGRMK